MASRTVLIAVDDSEQAEYAFEWYFREIRRPDDNLLMVYAAEVASTPAAPLRGNMIAGLFDIARGQAKEIEEKFTQKLREKGVEGRFNSQFGHPGQFIVEEATKENVTCIVIGTRGMGKIRRTLLGSVSDYVVHHAHCPVVVCRK